MFLKKATLVGMLAVLSFSVTEAIAANGDLVTNNTTHEPSTVKLLTGKKICSGSIGKPGITDGGEMHHTVPMAIVNDLCTKGSGSPGGKCYADIYMTRDCTGDVVGHAWINVNNGGQKGEVTIDSSPHAKYKVEKNGFSEITMSYR